jgi:hypothetical protein
MGDVPGQDAPAPRRTLPGLRWPCWRRVLPSAAITAEPEAVNWAARLKSCAILQDAPAQEALQFGLDAAQGLGLRAKRRVEIGSFGDAGQLVGDFRQWRSGGELGQRNGDYFRRPAGSAPAVLAGARGGAP